MALGDGFAAALRQATDGGSGELAGMFGKLFDQMAEDLYRRLRDDIIAEVRAEVQRAEASEVVDKLSTALAKIGTPVVHVEAPAPPNVTVNPPKVEVLAGDVEVNVPKSEALVTYAPHKHIEIRRNGDGQITGADVS